MILLSLCLCTQGTQGTQCSSLSQQPRKGRPHKGRFVSAHSTRQPPLADKRQQWRQQATTDTHAFCCPPPPLLLQRSVRVAAADGQGTNWLAALLKKVLGSQDEGDALVSELCGQTGGCSCGVRCGACRRQQTAVGSTSVKQHSVSMPHRAGVTCWRRNRHRRQGTTTRSSPHRGQE